MNFDTENAGTWFYFLPKDEAQGGICIRILSTEQSNKIDKVCTKIKVEYKKGNRFEVPITDEDRYDGMVWDEAIVDWKSVNELECTKENKIFIMTHSLSFAKFFADSMEKLSESIKVENEVSVKNSLTMQSGKETNQTA